MKLTYTGPYDEVEIPSLGLTCKRGESIDVSPEVAGEEPFTTTDEESGLEVENLGHGLLAQVGIWTKAAAKKKVQNNLDPAAEAERLAAEQAAAHEAEETARLEAEAAAANTENDGGES